MMQRLSRRDFLRVGAGGGALMALAGPVHAQLGRKQLVYAKNEDIGQLNPYFVNHAVFESLGNHIQEPMVRFDYERRTWEPVLAEAWGVEDKGKTWVFRLRDGVRFHDGTAFTPRTSNIRSRPCSTRRRLSARRPTSSSSTASRSATGSRSPCTARSRWPACSRTSTAGRPS